MVSEAGGTMAMMTRMIKTMMMTFMARMKMMFQTSIVRLDRIYVIDSLCPAGEKNGVIMILNDLANDF